jgi:hypothetical protein
MREFRRILSGIAFAGLSKLLLELAASTAATLIVTWALSSLVLTPQAPAPHPASPPARTELPPIEIPATIMFSPVVAEPSAPVPTPPPRTASLISPRAHDKSLPPARLARNHHPSPAPASTIPASPAPAPAAESPAPPLRLAGAGGEGRADIVGPPLPDPAPGQNERPLSRLLFLDRLPNPTSLLRPIGAISERLSVLLPKF